MTPILQQATMQMSKSGVVGSKVVNRIPKLVMLWKDVGLAIHKESITWTVSHFNSGRSVLKHLKSKEKAIEGMLKLANTLIDWTFTLKEWEQYSNEEKQVIKEKVDAIQYELLKTGLI